MALSSGIPTEARRSGRAAVAALCGVAIAAGCVSPLRLEPAPPSEQIRAAQRSILVDGSLSDVTTSVLASIGTAPELSANAAAQLRRLAAEQPGADRLIALAEVAYGLGRAPWGDPRIGRAYMAEAAFASWAALFRPDSDIPPFGPQSLLAQTIHNLAIARLAADASSLPLTEDSVVVCPLPDGDVAIEFAWRAERWNPESFVGFEAAQEFRVRGMRGRTRQSGIGGALLAERRRASGGSVPATELDLPQVQSVALTAVLVDLEFPVGRHWPPSAGRLEIVDPSAMRTLSIGGRTIPVQADFTAALTSTLGLGTHLRQAGLGGLRDVEHWSERAGLYMLEPFDPQRIPVVFSHGLVSSPLIWREMVNDLWSDPIVRERFQFWFYMYPTGNPFAFSAAQLRKDLAALRSLHDPRGDAPAFRDIVLIGHSMGGLVSRLLVTDPGDALWKSISAVPIEEAVVDEDDRELLDAVFFAGRMPEVSRVVFIAVPHRGSVIAEFAFARVVSGLIRLPASLVEPWTRLAENNPDRIKASVGRSWSATTGIESLSPGSRFLVALAELPIAEGVTAHSIIGRRNDSSEPGGSDGVVPFESAHLPDVASELIIPQSDHSVPMRPAASREVLRILREHLASIDARPSG